MTADLAQSKEALMDVRSTDSPDKVQTSADLPTAKAEHNEEAQEDEAASPSKGNPLVDNEEPSEPITEE